LPVFALENDRIASVLAVCGAVGLHAALAFGTSFSPVPASPPTIVSEIELAPPPPPPPPEPEEATPPKEEPAPSPPRAAAAAPPPPRAAARAGAIVAADPATKGSEDLVDFVTDPMGTSYGSGVVARGGTAEHSTGGRPRVVSSPPAPAATTARSGDGIAPAASLSRAARLQGDDPCRGFYPNEATADSGSAAISLVVLPSGQVVRASVASETPAGQGFGAAARRCLTAASFSPALDKSGQTVTAAVTVSVRFTR
jgi:protein TonB